MDLQQIPFKTDFTANTITIKWQGQYGQFNNYIVKYRAKDSKDAFEIERTSESEIHMSNLKNETLYEIKIFWEDSNGDESLMFKTEVRTVASIASKLLKSAEQICNDPVIYRVCPIKSTNLPEGIQIHEFFSDVKNKDERSLLLLGASGSGKSTLVDAFVNYLMDVSFADNFRFKITDEITQGEDIVCYKIRYQDGFKVGFNLNIIEVPGFQSGYDESVYRKLIALFHLIPAICAPCLVVPSFCRLTEEHRCIFNNILSIFGNDITYVIPFITFHDGGEVNALKSLTAADVKFLEHMHFRFNNSKLLSGNERFEVWNKRQNTMIHLLGEPTIFRNCLADKTSTVLECRIGLNQSLRKATSLQEQIEHREKSIKHYEFENSRQQRIRSRDNRGSDADKICINCNMCDQTCVFDCSLLIRFLWYLVVGFENIWSFICCICQCFRCCPRICRCSCKRAYCCCIKCFQRWIGCTCSCSFAHHVKEYGRYIKPNRDNLENANDIEDQNVFKIENVDEMQRMQNDIRKLNNELNKNYQNMIKYAECIQSTALLSELPEEVEHLKIYQERLLKH